MKIARVLRKNSTEAERKLWAVLRNRGLCNAKFRRQFPLGGYILDFYAPEYNLCVEADGGQHYLEGGVEEDEVRSVKLAQLGVRFLRFSNADIMTNIEGACAVIIAAIGDISNDSPSPQSSPQRGEEV
ncbi:MAG: endonuclease domain-containing protein [Deltaproteobacteria bacterium]|nr:endonuclease domain-containing protein [Deltaproteobacteria bacterium]